MKVSRLHNSEQNDSTGLRLADIVEEAAASMLAGEQVSCDAYVQRHPSLAEALREVWPALSVMAALSGSKTEPAPVDEALRLRGLVGDFRLLRIVGRGGMGVVYEAEQISLGRRVALKILPFAAVLDPTQLARFKNEAMAAALLEHPHIVPVYAVGCERGIHYYAMRFIEGQTLAEAFAVRHGEYGSAPLSDGERGRPSASENGAEGVVGPDVRTNDPGDALDVRSLDAHTHAPAPGGRAEPVGNSARVDRSAQRTLQATDTRRLADLSTQLTPASPAWWRRLADLGIQAAEALEYAHQHGIVHRDVKPGNLLLDACGQLWVADFGLAQVSGSADLTMTGDVLGTLRYMSPEQARGENILDQRTDVYSLGVTLYELLVRRPAFSAKDRQRLLRQIEGEEPTPPRQINKRVPADLETIVLKAMAKEPEDRYQSAAKLAEDLQRFLNERPLFAKRATWLTHTRKALRRYRGQLALVSTTAFLIASVAAGLLWRESQKTTRALATARANAEIGRKAVDEAYTYLSENVFANLPGGTKAQHELLGRAVAMYEQLLLNTPDDENLRAELALALIRNAETQPDGPIHSALLDRIDHEIQWLVASDVNAQRVPELQERLITLRAHRMRDRGDLEGAIRLLRDLFERTRGGAGGTLPLYLEHAGAFDEALEIYQTYPKSVFASCDYERGLADESYVRGFGWVEPVDAEQLASESHAGQPTGWAASIKWTNLAGHHRHLAAALVAARRIDEAADAIEQARLLTDWLVERYPQSGRFYDERNLVIWEQALISWLGRNYEMSRRHFSSLRLGGQHDFVTQRSDPMRFYEGRCLVASPDPQFRDATAANAIFLEAVGPGTTDPHWWAVKALCDYRLGDRKAGRASIARADLHWRSSDSFTEVVRLLLDKSGLPRTAEEFDERLTHRLGRRKHLSLEAEVLRREILMTQLGVIDPKPFDSFTDYSEPASDSTASPVKRR